MPICEYGLFWRKDDIAWQPGSGNKKTFRLLGRLGAQGPSLQLADFRRQQGIYVLYSQHGPYYVGLVSKNELGYRLRAHATGPMRTKWDRFSWFGFCRVTKYPDESGVHTVEELEVNKGDSPIKSIHDTEALLIHALGPAGNRKVMGFQEARRWEQVAAGDETEKYMERVQK